MSRENDNLPCDNSSVQLDRNLSRLIKQADDSNMPGKAFSMLLIDSALCELKQFRVQTSRGQKHTIMQTSWLGKAVGWAAMVAAACGTGLTFLLSTLLTINTFLTVIVIAHWMTYIGGLVL